MLVVLVVLLEQLVGVLLEQLVLVVLLDEPEAVEPPFEHCMLPS